MGQFLLQNGADITKWDNFITKQGRYYKVGQLLQSSAVQKANEINREQ